MSLGTTKIRRKNSHMNKQTGKKYGEAYKRDRKRRFREKKFPLILINARGKTHYCDDVNERQNVDANTQRKRGVFFHHRV